MISDLHIHTTMSDGKYDRYKLIDYFGKNGYEYVSFTDHNYVSKLTNYNNYIERKKYYNLKLINGAEFDVSNYKSLHILGYDIKDISLVNNKLNKLKTLNNELCIRLINNLKKEYGFDISLKDFNDNKSITKSEIRKILVEKHYANSNKEAGDLYTGSKSLFYEKTNNYTYQEIIELILESGGLPVLAHPSTLKLDSSNLFNFIKKLKEIGLFGIEVLNSDKTTKSQFELYKKISKDLNLVPTCGSDFHNEIATPTIGINNDINKQLIKIIERS